QVHAIAAALPWPVVVRQLVFKPRYRKGKPWFNASLRHIDRAQSAPLEGPWPDLVITIGRRPAMAALWIKAQSGGRTRIVIIGRPKRDLAAFDLVIGSAQYQLPDAANVVKIGLPLMRVEPDRLAAARHEWADRLAALPRPLVVLLVGGATKPYRLDADTVPELLAAAGHYAGAGGSIYISTSRRTGAAAQAALVAGCPANGHLYQAGSDAPNPYLALLDAGDAFVITGDSISMLTEAARLGRRIAVFDLPLHPFWGRLMRFRGLLERLRLVGFERNLGAFHQWLYAHNRAVPSGAALLTAAAPADDDGLLRVVARVRALLAAHEAPAGLAADARQSGTEEPSR
ncbi:MAG: ELM1/GtrOC1 family putative glycosyltransferase, partial [Gammaproteobacteria bacterium]